VRTAKLVESVTPEQMQRAQAYAQRFERRLMIAPAVSDLAAIVGREAVGA
jgi:hypothetical protein